MRYPMFGSAYPSSPIEPQLIWNIVVVSCVYRWVAQFRDGLQRHTRETGFVRCPMRIMKDRRRK